MAVFIYRQRTYHDWTACSGARSQLGRGTAAAQQPDLTIGTSAALGYRQYLDVPVQCCPLWTWVEFGSGRFGLHLDYLYSYRETERRGGYPLDGNDN